MIVNFETKEKWKNLYLMGDVGRIWEIMKKKLPEKDWITQERIRQCVTKGEFKKMALFEIVAEFYKKREWEIQKVS